MWELKAEIIRRADREYNVSRSSFYRMEASGEIDMDQVHSRIRLGSIRREYCVDSFRDYMDGIPREEAGEEKKSVPKRPRTSQPLAMVAING